MPHKSILNSLFSDVAEKYDLMNDIMSFGLHRTWKDQFVALLSPAAHKSYLRLGEQGILH